MYKKGFTLAEVLLTIAVIGIISVLIFPTLMHHIDKIRYANNYKKESSLLVQAIQRMKSLDDLQAHKSTEEFITALGKHAKIMHICPADDLSACFPKKITVDGEEVGLDFFRDSKSLGVNWEENTNILGFVLIDGTSVLTAYNTNCDPDKSPYNCASFVFDMNSINKRNKFEGNGISDIGTLNAKIIPPAAPEDDNDDDDSNDDSGDNGGDDSSGSGGRNRPGGLLGWLLDLLDHLFH